MPSEIRELDNEASLLAFRTTFFWLSVVVTCGYAPFALRNFSLGRYRVGAIQLVCCVCIVLLVLLKRRTEDVKKKYWIGQAVLAFTLLAGYLGAFFTGQGAATSAWVLLLGPLFSAYLFGRTSAKIWTAICVAGFLLLHLSGSVHPIEPDFVPTGWRVWGIQTVMLLVIFSFGRAFRQSVDRQIDSIRQRKAELRQARDQLERSYTELQNLDVARQQFVELLAHDMRNPITGIVGYAQLLTYEAGISEEGKQMIEGIEELTRGLNNKLADIVDVSRLENEELDLRLKEIDYAALCSEVAEELESDLLPPVTVEGPDSLPLVCDPRLLRRVLSNLLSNAQKFCSKERSVKIILQEVDGEIVTCVLDNSPQLSPEEKEQAFENLPYTGVKPSKRSFGLGLTLCKLAIERHGGAVGIEDVPEGGCQFRFTLPRLKSSGGSRKASVPPGSREEVALL